MRAPGKNESPLGQDRIYEVFARKDRADPFRHVGAITAPGPELARVYAWQTYDEQTWFEMTVAPRDVFVSVNQDKPPFALGGPPPVGEGSAADDGAVPGYGTPTST